MNALINVVPPVFGIILTGYLAGRLEVLGPDSAAALNRFVFYFALPPALFLAMVRAPIDKIFNWPFIYRRLCRRFDADASDCTGRWALLVSP